MGKALHDCRHSGCGLAYSLDIFGDKWTLIIVRDMVMGGKRHFGEFMASPEKMASNILSDRLKRLEESCIVSRTQDPANESKFIYELTPKGKELIPLVLDLLVWGSRHDPNSNTPAALLRWLNKDRDGAIKAILKSLKDKESFVHAHGFAPKVS
jgi:DNA-binding HxlR family transcriptional regulator